MPTTHWSLVLEARDGAGPSARRALEYLCQTYWVPLYAYARLKGSSRQTAQDLVQGFFALFLEKEVIRHAHAEHGRFRDFLLASFRNFTANEWDRQTALKRGGEFKIISLDRPDVLRQVEASLHSDGSPEEVYQREWAFALLRRARARLADEIDKPAAKNRFVLLEAFLDTDSSRVPYAELSEQSGISVTALRVSVHRLRKRYRDLVYDELSRTVPSDSDIHQELADLFAALEYKTLPFQPSISR